ncbi:MAG: SpoIIE family protein phosphatase [Planctomycetota bacterium]|jgi:serine phosphatase RsbU (regulator of sigma subunit)
MAKKPAKKQRTDPGYRAQISLFAGGEMHVLELDGPVTIGRSKRNKIRLRDDLISRKHCRIYPRGGGFHLDDLDSRNGTWLNGARIQSSPLKPGDVIDVGRCTLFYSLPEKESRYDIRIPYSSGGFGTITGGAGSPTVMGIDTRKSQHESLVGVDELASILRDRNNLIHLQQISKAINSEVEPDRLFEKIIDSAAELSRARRGFLLLPNGEDFTVAVSRSRSLDKPPSKDDLDEKVVQDALQKGITTRARIHLLGKRFFVLCVPCHLKDEVIGAVYLDAPEHETSFTSEDEKIITTLSEQAAITIENHRFHSEMKEKRALEKELEIAGQIQRRLFPPGPPVLPEVEIFGESLSATEVGGDYYDFIPSADGKSLTLCIADVSGKGISAGLIMVMARSMLRSLVSRQNSTIDNLMVLNRILSPDLENGRFISMILMYWDGEKKILRYTGAGHEHVLIYRASTGRCESTPAGGAVLGIPWDGFLEAFQEREVQLEPGDHVLLYTDGVIDARNAHNEFFGLRRLQRIVETQGNLKPDQLVYTILEKVSAFIGDFPAPDDITLVALQRK